MPEAEPVKHPREVLAVLLLASMSYALAQTLVVPAIPEISRQYDAAPSTASWLLTGFLLSASVATPIIGKLGDVYGKGRTLTVVMLLFSAGGVLCAVGDSIGVLIGGRVLQGVAAGVFPLAFGIVRDTFPPTRIASGLALVSTLFGVGAGLGLPLSGAITEHLGVSALFWVSLIGVPAAIAAAKLIPVYRAAEHARIDWPGALLLSLALVAILVAVTEANDWGWGSPRTLGLMAAGGVTLLVWLYVESRSAEPLIELHLLRQRAVAATNLAAVFVGFAMFVSFLLVPQLVQVSRASGYGLGLSVTEAGLIIMPAALTQLVGGPLAGRLGARVGFRLTLALGGGFCAAALGLLAIQHTHVWDFLVSAALVGTGISFAFASMANLIVDGVPQQEVGIATGINTVTRTVGGAFGAAVATALLATDSLTSSASPDAGYTAAFGVAGVAGLLAVGAALLIPASRPSSAVSRPATAASSGS